MARVTMLCFAHSQELATGPAAPNNRCATAPETGSNRVTGTLFLPLITLHSSSLSPYKACSGDRRGANSQS